MYTFLYSLEQNYDGWRLIHTYNQQLHMEKNCHRFKQFFFSRFKDVPASDVSQPPSSRLINESTATHFLYMLAFST